MKPIRLNAFSLRLPFKEGFSHASASRLETETFWVTASDGEVAGDGESCPRSYVTGEDLDSCNSFFTEFRKEWEASIADLSDLKIWSEKNRPRIDRSPAAWCAVELALLDLLARRRGLAVESLLALPFQREVQSYTAVVGDEAPEAFHKKLQRYRALGFRDFKIKLARDAASNEAKLGILKEYLPEIRVRADGNHCWPDLAAATEALESFQFPFTAIEEPIAGATFAELLELFHRTGTRVLLDESFLRRAQFREIASRPEAFLLNVRVSKMGGLLRSEEICREAGFFGIPYVIGCQVGETSLLTRAALALPVSGGVAGLREGAFGTHLLKEDICGNPIQFGAEGKLFPDLESYRFYEKKGWGLAVNFPLGSLAPLERENGVLSA